MHVLLLRLSFANFPLHKIPYIFLYPSRTYETHLALTLTNPYQKTNKLSISSFYFRFQFPLRRLFYRLNSIILSILISTRSFFII